MFLLHILLKRNPRSARKGKPPPARATATAFGDNQSPSPQVNSHSSSAWRMQVENLLSFLSPSAASPLQVGRAMAHLIFKNISRPMQKKLQRRHSVLLHWWCLQQALNGDFGCFKLCVIFLCAQITRAEPTFNCSYVFN